MKLEVKKLKEIYSKKLEKQLEELTQKTRQENLVRYLPYFQTELYRCPEELKEFRTHHHISKFLQSVIERIKPGAIIEADILKDFQQCVELIYLSQRAEINSAEINLFSSKFLPMLFFIASLLQPSNPTALLFPRLNPEKLHGLMPGQFIISDEGDIIDLSELMENARIRASNNEPPPYFLHIRAGGLIKALSSDELAKIAKLCKAQQLCDYVKTNRSEEVIISNAYNYIKHLITGLNIGSNKVIVGEGTEEVAAPTAELVIRWFIKTKEQLSEEDRLQIEEIKNQDGKNIFQLLDETLINPPPSLNRRCVNFASEVLNGFLTNQQDFLRAITLHPPIKGCVMVADQTLRQLLNQKLTAHSDHLPSSDLVKLDKFVKDLHTNMRKFLRFISQDNFNSNQLNGIKEDINQIKQLLIQLRTYPDILSNYHLWEILYNADYLLSNICDYPDQYFKVYADSTAFLKGPLEKTVLAACQLLEEALNKMIAIPALGLIKDEFKFDVLKNRNSPSTVVEVLSIWNIFHQNRSDQTVKELTTNQEELAIPADLGAKI